METATTTNVRVTSSQQRGGWTIGELKLDGETVKFQAKVYDEPSQYGINDGRISKLWVARTDGVALYNYDRGEDHCSLPTRYVDAIVAAIEVIG